MRFMRRILFLGLLPALAMAASEPVTVKGVILCKALSSKAEERLLPTGIEGGMIVAEAQTRESELTPACQKSGYGIFTPEADSVNTRIFQEAVRGARSRNSQLRFRISSGVVDLCISP